ncbi:uncharacterized protein LOC144981291 isoform X2 [Oryzias latipes]
MRVRVTHLSERNLLLNFLGRGHSSSKFALPSAHFFLACIPNWRECSCAAAEKQSDLWLQAHGLLHHIQCRKTLVHNATISGSLTCKMRDAWVNTPLLLLLLLLASLTRTAISQDNEGAENTEDTENTENDENVEKAEEVSDLASDNTQDDSQPDNTEEEPNTTQENGGDLATQSETEITTESTAVQDDLAESTENLPDDASTRSPTTLDEASSSATEGSAEDPLSEEAPVTYDLDYVSSDSSTEEPGDSTLMLILIPVVIVTLICMVVCGYFIIRKWKQNATKRASVKEDPFLDEPSTEKVPMPMFEEDVPSVLELEMEDFDQWITKDC